MSDNLYRKLGSGYDCDEENNAYNKTAVRNEEAHIIQCNRADALLNGLKERLRIGSGAIKEFVISTHYHENVRGGLIIEIEKAFANIVEELVTICGIEEEWFHDVDCLEDKD